AERGTMFFPGAAVYMDKIACGPEAVDAIDINASPADNVEAVAEAKSCEPTDVSVVVLERDRHNDRIQELPYEGAKVNHNRAGDDVFVAATGVTSGALLRGVQYTSGGAITDSIVMRSRSGTVRRIEAQHAFAKLEKLVGSSLR